MEEELRKQVLEKIGQILKEHTMTLVVCQKTLDRKLHIIEHPDIGIELARIKNE
jgi:hypothetical protein